MLRRASAATRGAKHSPHGYSIYAGGQEERNERRLALMGDLRRAIEADHLEMHFQPKVSIATRKVCGAEALVRWRHPVHGMIPTLDFVTLAEQVGLITALTRWVLGATFRQSAAWRRDGLDVPLSINLSAHDLQDADLVPFVRHLFDQWNVPRELIEFELTESALMNDPQLAQQTLRDLKRCGTKLVIDDFGTGYSSLSYLQNLSVDAIKIDQSFVKPMTTNCDSAKIVRAVVDLGHILGLSIVAEGVENHMTWDALLALSCDVAQGFLMSAPLSASELPLWMAAWQSAPAYHQ